MSEHFLDDLRAEAAEVATKAKRLRDELGHEQLAFKSAPDVWSIAEVFQHLSIGGRLYEPGMQAVLVKARGRPVSGRRPFDSRPIAGWFASMAGPDGARKLKAPKRFRPTVSAVGADAIDEFLKTQERFMALIDAARDADLNHPRFGSPVTPLLRFSLGEALLLLVRHQQRHLGQAERVMQHPAFPEGA